MLKLWPLNRLIYATWRHVPFPPGMRSRIIRSANDKFLIGVIAVIFDPQGRVMLVRNTYDPRSDWSLPGGWMGRHEQPDECVQRELMEETGFEIEVTGLLTARTDAKIPAMDLVYGARVVGGGFRPGAEITAAEFFELDELPDRLTPGHARMARRFQPDCRTALTGGSV